MEMVKEDLAKDGFSVGEEELGIMIETPAAAVISDKMEKEEEFISIGKYNITMYTLAVVHQN